MASTALKFEQECTIKTTVSCYISSDYNSNCNDIRMQPNSCEDVDITFGFRYCNLHKHNSIEFVLGEMRVNHELIPENLDDSRELQPMKCKELMKSYTVNSCAHSFQADMKVEGWKDNESRCASDDTFIFIRPLFEASD